MPVQPNRVQLTPLSLLERAATVFGDRAAIVDERRRYDYAAFAEEAQALGRAIRSRTRVGDRVAILAPNVAELLIAHFAVPLAGCALVAINIRLSGEEIAYILEHSGASVLIVEPELLDLARAALRRLGAPIQLVLIGTDRETDAIGYASLLQEGRALDPLPWTVADEDAVISINYTSGTTGRPKGVMYSHRGAYLNSMGLLHHLELDGDSRYLWTLPMFHCNGWCTAWAVTAAAALHICLRAVREAAVWDAIDRFEVTHMCGAPTVLTTVAHAPQAHLLTRPIRMISGGAPPSPAIIERLESLDITPVHMYGLTESYGPFTICEYRPEWSRLADDVRAAHMARQGVAMLQSGTLRVVDAEMRDVAADGTTLGEILMRGNNIMLGYYRDAAATEEAFRGGWFHTGDLAVMHPGGYIEVKDRAKDIIISGGENVSSIEVENALMSHPSVLDAAVVGIPDERWGERPVAYVVLQDAVPPDRLVAFLREELAHFKVPDRITLLEALPRTSTGKVLKRELRELALQDDLGALAAERTRFRAEGGPR